jgi:DNA-binding transcriptional LysR family regulator
LTKQGEILLEYAKQITCLVEEAAVKMKGADQQNPILSVYVSNYIAIYFFKDIMDHFHQTFPKQMLEINSYCYDDLKRNLVEGKANFALMPIYPEDEYIAQNCEIKILFEDDFSLVLPPDHPWTKRKQLYARDLHNQTILLPQSHYLQQYIAGQMEQRDIRVRFLQMSNFEMIKQAVRTQHGIAFLPNGAVREELAKGELAATAVSSLKFKRYNGFVKRKNVQLSESEKMFYSEVERFLRQA